MTGPSGGTGPVGSGLVVRLAGNPVIVSAGVMLTAVLSAEWIDPGGVRHPIPVASATRPAALCPEPADIDVELDQHIVIHELPDGRLHTESVIRVVVAQDGERQVVERHDEQVFTKHDDATDLVIEQDDMVRVRLDDEGGADVDLGGGMRVGEQPADPFEAVPGGGVVVVQDQDLVVTDVDDGVFDDIEDPDVVADFAQSATTTGDPYDDAVDPISISQDQDRADLFVDSTAPGSVPEPGPEPTESGWFESGWFESGWFDSADPVLPESEPAGGAHPP